MAVAVGPERAQTAGELLLKLGRIEPRPEVEREPEPEDPRPILVRLREELARYRDAGVTFDAAWGPARRTALAGVPSWDRTIWTYALGGTRYAWRDAYEGRGERLYVFDEIAPLW